MKIFTFYKGLFEPIKGSLDPKKRLLKFEEPFLVTKDSSKEDSLEPKEGSSHPRSPPLVPKAHPNKILWCPRKAPWI